MHILWLDTETAHIKSRDANNDNTVNILHDCLTWHRMGGDEDSHMARTRSSLIVITDTEDRYWVSLVFEDPMRRINANEEISDVDCLDDALMQATGWALAKINQYETAS